MLTMLLSGCSTDRINPTNNAVCDGFLIPIEGLANDLSKEYKKTPDTVMVSGVRVIKVFDAQCKS